ncbi:MAG: twin-arginine translocation signal domain-containing protein [Anaerolineales bacterium]
MSDIKPEVERSVTEEVQISRRRLLKALAAAGGAVAVSSMLPKNWEQPVVEGGVLPAHAQVSEEPVQYIIRCDSVPGGGDILLDSDYIGLLADVTATVEVYQGSGPVADIDVTMECSTPEWPQFNPSLPQVATTGSSGVASFGDFEITGEGGESFLLEFAAVDPVNGTPLTCTCGVFRLVQPQ